MGIIGAVKTIEQLRREHNWTQKELGAKVGVSGQAVYNWEAGNKAPSASTLRRLAQAFGVCMEEIDFERPARERAGGAGSGEE